MATGHLLTPTPTPPTGPASLWQVTCAFRHVAGHGTECPPFPRFSTFPTALTPSFNAEISPVIENQASNIFGPLPSSCLAVVAEPRFGEGRLLRSRATAFPSRPHAQASSSPVHSRVAQPKCHPPWGPGWQIMVLKDVMTQHLEQRLYQLCDKDLRQQVEGGLLTS